MSVRRSFNLAWIPCLLAAAAAAAAAAASASGREGIPSFDFPELSSGEHDLERFEHAARHVGAFALSGLSREYNEAVSELRGEFYSTNVMNQSPYSKFIIRISSTVSIQL